MGEMVGLLRKAKEALKDVAGAVKGVHTSVREFNNEMKIVQESGVEKLEDADFIITSATVVEHTGIVKKAPKTPAVAKVINYKFELLVGDSERNIWYWALIDEDEQNECEPDSPVLPEAFYQEGPYDSIEEASRRALEQGETWCDDGDSDIGFEAADEGILKAVSALEREMLAMGIFVGSL